MKLTKEQFTARYNTTEEELTEIGLDIVPCNCTLDFCPGLQLKKNETFSNEVFNRKFTS